MRTIGFMSRIGTFRSLIQFLLPLRLSRIASVCPAFEKNDSPEDQGSIVSRLGDVTPPNERLTVLSGGFPGCNPVLDANIAVIGSAFRIGSKANLLRTLSTVWVIFAILPTLFNDIGRFSA